MQNFGSRGGAQPDFTPTNTAFRNTAGGTVFVCALLLFFFTVAYMAYGDKYFGFFKTIYYELVAMATSAVALFLYVCVSHLLRNTKYATSQNIKLQKYFAIALVVPFLGVTVGGLLLYKKQEIGRRAAQQQALLDSVSPSERAAADRMRACEYAQMRLHKANGASLLDADQMAHSYCVLQDVAHGSVATQPEALHNGNATLQTAGGGATSSPHNMLQRATAQEWSVATDTDRLSASIALATAATESDRADVAVRATELDACITRAASSGASASLAVKDLAAACMVLLGHDD